MPDHSADRDEMIETAIRRALDTLTPKGAAVVSRVALEHQACHDADHNLRAATPPAARPFLSDALWPPGQGALLCQRVCRYQDYFTLAIWTSVNSVL
jgi:hypothetical protein